MSKATRATEALSKGSVPFAIRTYEYHADAEHIGLQAAEALGEDPGKVLKTLMASVDGKPVCAIIPSNREVSMKRLAAAFQGKSASMLPPAEAERMSGYNVGGISPFGQKRRHPVAIEESTLAYERVCINGGQRGLQLSLCPKDAARFLEAVVASVIA